MKKAAYILFALLIAAALNAEAASWKHIATGTGASFRGLSVVDNHVAWASGSKGYAGVSSDGGNTWKFRQVKGYEKCDFRSVYAFDDKHAVIANAGAPAFILTTRDGGITWKEVYKNSDSAVFFDGIGFWDSKCGIIYGDPVNGHMLLLRTNDGGNTWKELPEKSCPEMIKGEASFAASGTAIRCRGNSGVTIATGGKVSRLLCSDDRGDTWRPFNTPIIQGLSTTGIFSLAYASEKKIIIVGGDYKRDTLRSSNAFVSNDGGTHWVAPASPPPGYRECVEVIDSKTAIAVGPGGMDISYDLGIHWLPFSDEKQFHVARKSRKGNLVIVAGGEGMISILKL